MIFSTTGVVICGKSQDFPQLTTPVVEKIMAWCKIPQMITCRKNFGRTQRPFDVFLQKVSVAVNTVCFMQPKYQISTPPSKKIFYRVFFEISHFQKKSSKSCVFHWLQRSNFKISKVPSEGGRSNETLLKRNTSLKVVPCKISAKVLKYSESYDNLNLADSKCTPQRSIFQHFCFYFYHISALQKYFTLIFCTQ